MCYKTFLKREYISLHVVKAFGLFFQNVFEHKTAILPNSNEHSNTDDHSYSSDWSSNTPSNSCRLTPRRRRLWINVEWVCNYQLSYIHVCILFKMIYVRFTCTICCTNMHVMYAFTLIKILYHCWRLRYVAIKPTTISLPAVHVGFGSHEWLFKHFVVAVALM